jgi:hypothetical protein
MTNGRKTRRLSYWGGGAALITLIWSTAIYCRFESSDEWASLRNELQEQNAIAVEVGTVNEVDLLFSGFNHASYDLSAEIKARVRVRGSAGSAISDSSPNGTEPQVEDHHALERGLTNGEGGGGAHPMPRQVNAFIVSVTPPRDECAGPAASPQLQRTHTQAQATLNPW